jgi:hypothetical protein
MSKSTNLNRRDALLSAGQAASSLGISRATLYEMLNRSDAGTLVIRGQPVTIDYFQGGARGQGRIRLELQEVERLNEAMRVRPRPSTTRRPPVRKESFPGITVQLGRPT